MANHNIVSFPERAESRNRIEIVGNNARETHPYRQRHRQEDIETERKRKRDGYVDEMREGEI